jgi:hypothetical protein
VTSSENDRREHTRAKLKVPVEILVEGNSVSSRGNTSDLSMGGFYIETMFTMAVGTILELTLHLADTPVLAAAIVATCDPLVGNGIHFTKMLPEDRQALSEFIQAHETAHDEAASEEELPNKTDELLEP